MALTVPDYANATASVEQAGLDSVDVDAIVAGAGKVAFVLSGGVVSQRAAGANLSVDVSAGGAAINGGVTSWAATNVAVTADPSNPRFTAITVNSSGVVSATSGVAAASPVYPAIPANSALLGMVFVPAAAASIVTADIYDKRILTTQPTVVGSGVANSSAYLRFADTSVQAELGFDSFAGSQFTDSGANDPFWRVTNPAKTIRIGLGAVGASASVLRIGASSVALPVGVDLTVGTKTTKSNSLALPATANTATVLGQFTTTNGSLALRFHMHMVSGTTQRSKTYEFVVDKTTDTTNTYYKLLPADQSSSQSATSDFFLVAYRPSTATTTWQVWVCSSTTFASTGTLTWMVESYGDTTVTYASSLSPATASPTLPFTGGLHPSNSLNTVAGQVAIGTDVPTSGASLDIAPPTGHAELYLRSVNSTWDAFITLRGNGGVNGDGFIGQPAIAGTYSTDTSPGDLVVLSPTGRTLRLGVGGGVASTLRVTGSDVQINDNGTARSVPRGAVARVNITANSSALGTTETVSLGNIGTVAIVSGRKYRFVLRCRYTLTGASVGAAASHTFRLILGGSFANGGAFTGVNTLPGTTAPVSVIFTQREATQTSGTYMIEATSYDLVGGTDIPTGVLNMSISTKAASGTVTLVGSATGMDSNTMVSVIDAGT